MNNKLFYNIVRKLIILLLSIIPTICLPQIRENNNQQYLLVGCDSTIWLCQEDPWILIFEDEFEGDTLNMENWDVYIGVPRDPNFEKQKAWHQEENVKVSEGTLKIITQQEQNYNMQYISSYNPSTSRLLQICL